MKSFIREKNFSLYMVMNPGKSIKKSVKKSKNSFFLFEINWNTQASSSEYCLDNWKNFSSVVK